MIGVPPSLCPDVTNAISQKRGGGNGGGNSTPPWVNDPTIDDWGPADDVMKAAKVWSWICSTGGWWGENGCPTEKDMAAWLLFHERSDLYNDGLWSLTLGIRYRFRNGMTPKALSGFTSFINPNRGATFDAGDWASLMKAPAQKYIDMVTNVYKTPISPGDYFYQYWWDKEDKEDGSDIDEAKLPEGSYRPFGTQRGDPFYFGTFDGWYCATQGINCKP